MLIEHIINVELNAIGCCLLLLNGMERSIPRLLKLILQVLLLLLVPRQHLLVQVDELQPSELGAHVDGFLLGAGEGRFLGWRLNALHCRFCLVYRHVLAFQKKQSSLLGFLLGT